MFSREIGLALTLGMGLFWTLTYILIIRRGFKDSALGMPMLALCANISWELIFTFAGDPPQRYVNALWFLFDVGIMIQAVRFGTRDLRSALQRKLFYPFLLLATLAGFCVLLPVASRFHEQGAIYSGYVMNVMMSVLFMSMLIRRNSVDGQSMYIAIAKLLGTLFGFVLVVHDPLVRFLYPIVFVFDVAYALALYAKLLEAQISPWRRV